MSRRLAWDRDGTDWPNRAFSRFVSVGSLRWHVQVMGSGPPLLLVHGTGAATHSWRALAPALAPSFTVIAPDLPGHGFTDTPPRATGFTLPCVARALAALLRAIHATPALVAGHSAGAAILARMCLDGSIAPAALVSLNGALLPFHGLTDAVFGPIARGLASTGATAWIFARLVGGRASVERLLRATGSVIDGEGIRLYARLAANPVHVGGALNLMANWDLHPLARDLGRLTQRLVLVTGERDAMVPPAIAVRVRALVPSAELVRLPGVGHLAHEERPATIARLLMRVAAARPCAGDGCGGS